MLDQKGARHDVDCRCRKMVACTRANDERGHLGRGEGDIVARRGRLRLLCGENVRVDGRVYAALLWYGRGQVRI